MTYEAGREIIAFMSDDFDGRVEDAQIVDDGTRGFCILRNGEYVVHEGTSLQYMWVDYDTAHPVRLSILDRSLIAN